MQLNRTGVWLIGFFGLGGLALAVAPLILLPGEEGLIFASVGAIWFLVALGLVFYARGQNRKAAHRDWVFRNGIRGSATVVSASSFATVNEMPVMRLKLDLEVPGAEPRRVKCREIMSVFAAHRLGPGLVLPVYVNPEDESDFVLVW